MTGQYSKIICQNTPENFRLKMLPAFPITGKYLKATFNVRDNCLYRASPFLQSGDHVETTGNILHATHYFIENNISYTCFLRIVQVIQTCIASVSCAVSRNNSIIFNNPVDRGLIQ